MVTDWQCGGAAGRRRRSSKPSPSASGSSRNSAASWRSAAPRSVRAPAANGATTTPTAACAPRSTRTSRRLAQLYCAALASTSMPRSTQGIDRTAWLLSLLGALAVLLAAAGALIIRRGVARPLADITRVTEQVAAGERDVAVPYGERRDEIGALAALDRGVPGRHAPQRGAQPHRASTTPRRARSRQERMSAEIARFGADVEATLAELGRISDQMLAASSAARRAPPIDAARRTDGRRPPPRPKPPPTCATSRPPPTSLPPRCMEIDRQVAQSNAIAEQGGRARPSAPTRRCRSSTRPPGASATSSA